MDDRKIAIYARVSTEEQAKEGYSLGAQVDACKVKIGNEEFIVYQDEGISGKNIKDRPALNKLLNTVRKGRIKTVYVWKVNRLSRDTRDALAIMDILINENTKLICLDLDMDVLGADGKMMYTIIATFGERERKGIIENVKSGMMKKAKGGEWNGGVILGYDSNRQNEHEKKRLVINNQESLVVKKIFNMYVNGGSYRNIASTLNEYGYRSKKGKEFSANAIKDILSNKIYIGKISFSLRNSTNRRKREETIIVDGLHDTIIEKDLFNQVQEIMKQKQTKPSRTMSGSALLTGLMKCPCCGASLVKGTSSWKNKKGKRREYTFYKCSKRTAKGANICNFKKTINGERIEREVTDKIVSLANNARLVEDIIKEVNSNIKNKIDPLNKERQTLCATLRKEENNKRKIFDLFEEDQISKEDISERLLIINKRIQDLKSRIDEIDVELGEEHEYEEINPKEIQDILTDVLENLRTQDAQAKKLIINLLISEVKVNEAAELEKIEMNFGHEITGSSGATKTIPKSLTISI